MGAVLVSAAVVLAALVGYGVGAQPVTVGGCYVMDIGTPGDAWPVLVSDTTPDGLCDVRS